MTLIGIAAIGFLILAVIGKRGVVALFLIAMALAVFVGSRAPVMHTETEVIPHPSVEECRDTEREIVTLPQVEQDILAAGCPGRPSHYPH